MFNRNLLFPTPSCQNAELLKNGVYIDCSFRDGEPASFISDEGEILLDTTPIKDATVKFTTESEGEEYSSTGLRSCEISMHTVKFNELTVVSLTTETGEKYSLTNRAGLMYDTVDGEDQPVYPCGYYRRPGKLLVVLKTDERLYTECEPYGYLTNDELKAVYNFNRPDVGYVDVERWSSLLTYLVYAGYCKKVDAEPIIEDGKTYQLYMFDLDSMCVQDRYK